MKWLVALAVLGGCDLVYSLDRPVSGWAELDPATDHVCGRTRDSALFCWGGNLYGQVGLGDELRVIDAPTAVAGRWSTFSIGLSHMCAIRDDNTLWCWGNNASGMLGTDATSTRIPKQVDGTWSDVATGFFTTCALDAERHLWCWGFGTSGQIGDGETETRTLPVMIGDATWSQIASSGLHTCGVQQDKTLWCWGDGSLLELGDPALTAITPSPAPIGTETWSSIVAHADGMCGITTDHRLRCWGPNHWGQLGIGDALIAETPTAVTIDDVDVDDWQSVDGGYFIGCGIRDGGEAWCWGDNQRTPLGDGSLTFPRPVRIEHPEGRGWTSARAGTVNACFVDDTYRAWCSGANGQSQRGDGGTSPRQPALIDDIATDQIDAGDRVTCAVRGTELSCAGSGSNGQLGDDSPFARQTLAPVNGTWRSVTSGADHQCALDATGKAYCWGSDFFTALGNGAGRMDTTAPVAVAVGARLFVAIDAGTSHTCAIGTAGAITCWGYGGNGQIGDGNATNAEVPRVITGGVDWAHLSAGGGHTCAIDVSGKVLCWGLNATGELGDGSTVDRAAPVALRASGLPAPPLPATFTAIAAGAEHSCAVGDDTSMWCWGNNTRGQLAVGTGFATSASAAIALADSGWRSVSAGAAHTCGIKTDGTLWCWGANQRGQLGDGSLTDRRSPTRIEGEGWTAVTCGFDHTCGIREGRAYCWGNNDDGTTATGDAWASTLTEIKEPAR